MSIDSIIKIWHGAGAMNAYSSHDGDRGNATLTQVRIDFHDSYPEVEIERDKDGYTESITLSIYGGLERDGLGTLFKTLGKELLKTEGDVGETISIGDDYEDESSGALAHYKGLAGESALNKWFNAVGISYLYINQSPETFAKLFNANLKRPDFLVLLESIGLIAVDAKNYKLYENSYSLPLESELKRVLTFERLFRIPVWYAYMGQESGTHGPVWHWISALKALEVGQIRRNSTTQEEFLSIDLSHFERIDKNEDIGKLYTHRLPSLKKLHRS